MKKLVAWLGGGVFVGSLALLAWWYFGLLGRGGSGGGIRALIVDAALVLIFAGHHSVFARDPVKRRLAFIPADMLTSFYVWVASLLLLAVPLFWVPIGGDLYRVRGWLSYVFVAVQLAGLWISSRAVAGLDALELAGIRQVIGSRGRPQSRALQVRGPYRYVRHPLYLGWVLMFFGAGTMTIDRLTFAGLTTLYLAMAVPWEEKGLKQSYGAEYARYSERVKWRMVPYLY
jgi:methanethiol S-methyltransferase